MESVSLTLTEDQHGALRAHLFRATAWKQSRSSHAAGQPEEIATASSSVMFI
jgi:hypothetical protein